MGGDVAESVHIHQHPGKIYIFYIYISQQLENPEIKTIALFYFPYDVLDRYYSKRKYPPTKVI